MIETTPHIYGDYYDFIRPALVPDKRVQAIRQYIDAQYAKYDRYYHNLAYLTRVLTTLDAILQAEVKLGNTGITDEENQDAFAAALFHRVYMTNRSVDNAHTIGFLTKKQLDQEYYPRSQRVATLVEQTDFIHFPTGNTYGHLVDCLRDAVLCEACHSPDINYERRLAYFRRDMGWDWKALALHYGKLWMEWLTTSPLQTEGARALYGKSLKQCVEYNLAALKPRLKASIEVH